jgi:hypothetical protein
MNAITATGDLPILALRRSGIERAGIPDKWHGDDAAIAQRHAERILAEFDVQDTLICRGKTHSMPP